jgi:replicative DNA helicase
MAMVSNLYSVEAERYVIGCLLINPLKIAEMSGIKEESFFDSSHRLIFKAIQDLLDCGAVVDIVTVSDRLAQEKVLEQVGGRAYINDLALEIISTANVGYYAQVVADKAMMRRIGHISGNISEMIAAGEEKERVIDRAQDLFLSLCKSHKASRPFMFSEFIVDVYNGIEGRVANKGKLAGLDSGFHDLNYYTGGLQKSDLVIVAARPSMGKTALALNIAENVAEIHAAPVVYFSLEMSKEQLGQRLLTSRCEVNSLKVRNGDLSDNELIKIQKELADAAKLKLIIDDTPGITIAEITAKCKELQYSEPLGLVIIDYLQLIGNKNAKENRTQEISDISRGLKNLARELNVPVIALSQLSRAVEQRTCKKPILSDLRESGSIEQDADTVLFIYRDEYYNPDNSDKRGKAEIIISKQRNGPVGSFELLFQPNLTRFKNLHKSDSVG